MVATLKDRRIAQMSDLSGLSLSELRRTHLPETV
jgi:hypothetical protein